MSIPSRGRRSLLLSLALALVATGCATTVVKTAWRSPEAKPVQFTNVLAVVVSSDTGARRVGEADICEQIRPTACTPSYRVLGDGALPERDVARARLTADGFDGAIVMRLLSERQKQTYVPPAYSHANWGFYRTAYPMMASPGYMRSDTLVRVETAIYDLPKDQLVWIGTTETTNPENVSDLIADIAKAVGADMRKHGLLPAQ